MRKSQRLAWKPEIIETKKDYNLAFTHVRMYGCCQIYMLLRGLSDTPAKYQRAAQAPGQDNDYVLIRLLGLSSDEVDRLRRIKVI